MTKSFKRFREDDEWSDDTREDRDKLKDRKLKQRERRHDREAAFKEEK